MVASGLGDLNVIVRGALLGLARGRRDPYAHTGTALVLSVGRPCVKVLNQQRCLRRILFAEGAAAVGLGRGGGVDGNGGAVVGDRVRGSVGAVRNVCGDVCVDVVDMDGFVCGIESRGFSRSRKRRSVFIKTHRRI
jgi:hypothetical protein